MSARVDYDDDTEMGDEYCPKCSGTTRSRTCSCDNGYNDNDHDCGEDTCCCLDPEPGRCSECDGAGWFNWCPTCGWDLVEKRFMNGRDERTVTEKAT